MALGLGRSDAGMIRTAWELSAGMLSLVFAIGIGWWFGGLLDGWFGTAPWLMLLFLCLGLAAGVLNVYRAVSGAMRSTTPAGAPGRGGPGAESPRKTSSSAAGRTSADG
jgi:ATP synthase protein I